MSSCKKSLNELSTSVSKDAVKLIRALLTAAWIVDGRMVMSTSLTKLESSVRADIRRPSDPTTVNAIPTGGKAAPTTKENDSIMLDMPDTMSFPSHPLDFVLHFSTKLAVDLARSAAPF